MRRLPLLLLATLLCAFGCEGTIDLPGRAPNGPGASMLPGTTPVVPVKPGDPIKPVTPKERSYACTSPLAQGLTFNRLRRITKLELTRRLIAAVGETIVADSVIASRLNGLNDERTRIAGDLSPTVPLAWATVLSVVARRAVELGLANPTWR